jgi:hypothetical protein
VHAVLIAALFAAAVALAFRLGNRRKWATIGTLALVGLAVLHPVIFGIAAAVVLAAAAFTAWRVIRRHRSRPAAPATAAAGTDMATTRRPAP